MNLAVVVTTYNRPDALAAVLDGYAAQTTHVFELLVADDGSKPETGQLVADYARRMPYALRHVWQEDLGFRPGAARNRALAATTADYVVFTDGDCVPARTYVARQIALAERGHFLAGNRMLLSPRYTQRVLEERIPIHEHTPLQWLAAWARRDVNRALPLLQLPDGAFRKRDPQRWRGVKSCNLSGWREDFLRVNGFDEAYSGWGLEDSDLVIRLLHAGVHHKTARFSATLFHLWHREQDRSSLPENQQRLDELLQSDRIEAGLGVRQYL